MITVFGEGRGFRVVWLLEEMGLLQAGHGHLPGHQGLGRRGGQPLTRPRQLTWKRGAGRPAPLPPWLGSPP